MIIALNVVYTTLNALLPYATLCINNVWKF